MSKIRDLGEENQGMYQWVASQDGDGDQVILGNTKSKRFLVVYVKTKDGRVASALISKEEVREMALAAMDLLEGVKPTITTSEEL